MRTIQQAILALSILFLTISESSALDMTLSAQIGSAFNESFEPLPGPYPIPGTPAYYQVDLFVSVSNLLPGELGFGGIIFVPEYIGVTDPGFGWSQNPQVVDTNGPAAGGLAPLFLPPGDISVQVVQPPSIYVRIANGVTNPIDPRYNVGKGSQTFLGNLFVYWDGTGYGKLDLDPIGFQVNSTSGQLSNGQIGVGTSLIFGVPEPSSILLASLGLGGLVLRRKL
jgi:hypothetical protein